MDLNNFKKFIPFLVVIVFSILKIIGLYPYSWFIIFLPDIVLFLFIVISIFIILITKTQSFLDKDSPSMIKFTKFVDKFAIIKDNETGITYFNWLTIWLILAITLQILGVINLPWYFTVGPVIITLIILQIVGLYCYVKDGLAKKRKFEKKENAPITLLQVDPPEN